MFTKYPDDVCKWIKRKDSDSFIKFLSQNNLRVVDSNRCGDLLIVEGYGFDFEHAFQMNLQTYVHRKNEKFVITASKKISIPRLHFNGKNRMKRRVFE